jgi:hypothetical protein
MHMLDFLDTSSMGITGNTMFEQSQHHNRMMTVPYWFMYKKSGLRNTRTVAVDVRLL